MSMLKTAAFAAAAAFALASQAAAAVLVVSSSTALPTSLGALPTADATTGTVFQNTTGSESGVRRSPWENTATPDEFYTSVSGNASATYLFGGLKDTLSLMWGSPDSYNTLSFFSGATFLGAITGGEIQAPPTGLGFVVVTLDPGAEFDRVVFDSGRTNAFEYANVEVAPVPLPAAAGLLGAGLAALGLIRGRRRTA